MTLSDAIARVRSLLHEPVAKMWSDTEIATWLNDGQKAMCVRRGIEEIWTGTLDNESSIVVTPDMLSIYKVVVNGDTLKRYAYKIFRNTVFFVEDSSDTPKAQTGLVMVYGTRSPAQAIGSIDFEIPDTFMDGPIDYAMEMANLKDENYSEAQIYAQLFAAAQHNWETAHKYAESQITNQWL